MLPCFTSITVYTAYTDHKINVYAYEVSYLLYAATGASGKVPIVCHCE